MNNPAPYDVHFPSDDNRYCGKQLTRSVHNADCRFVTCPECHNTGRDGRPIKKVWCVVDQYENRALLFSRCSTFAAAKGVITRMNRGMYKPGEGPYKIYHINKLVEQANSSFWLIKDCPNPHTFNQTH